MCHQNVTEPQAQNTHTKSTHCESGLDISMLHRGKSQLPNFSADLLSVPPVWPLFLQQSQLPISPAELLSVPPVWPLFLQQFQLPISSAELLSVPPVWPLFLQHAASAANRSCRRWHKTAVFALLYNEKFYAKHSLLYNGKILCQHCLAVTQGKLLC